jgi:hypothetical protein
LQQLHWLEISDTQVDDAGLAHLKGLARLRSLDLENTRVTAEGVKELQQSLPTTEVHR